MYQASFSVCLAFLIQVSITFGCLADEKQTLTRDNYRTLIFGKATKPNIPKEWDVLWTNEQGIKEGEVRFEIKMTAKKFNATPIRSTWKEMPIPQRHLDVLHMGVNTPKSIMTYFTTDRFVNTPELLWSHGTGVGILIIKLPDLPAKSTPAN